MLVPRIISRNAHQKFAEILPAQEADKGPRRISSPSTTSSRYLIRPSPTQAETSCMKSP